MKLQQLLSLTRKAVDEYRMIEDGDRIAVGISGGKDSLRFSAPFTGCSAFIHGIFRSVPSRSTWDMRNLISDGSGRSVTTWTFLIRLFLRKYHGLFLRNEKKPTPVRSARK